MSLVLNTTDGPINLLCVYAPTLTSLDEVKDRLYSSVESIIRIFSKDENLIILGDFNSHVSSDNEARPRPLGNFGVRKYNGNGRRLLELCSFFDLCVTNTFFSTGKCHRVSWRHPRFKHWHQLDLILMR